MKLHHSLVGIGVLSLIFLGAGCSGSSSMMPSDDMNTASSGTSTLSAPVVMPMLSVMPPASWPAGMALTDTSSFSYTNPSSEWGAVQWLAAFPTSTMKKTNLQAASVSAYSVTGTCVTGEYETDLTTGTFAGTSKRFVPVKTITTTGGVVWEAKQWGGAAAGTTADSLIYHATYQGNCYRLSLDLWSSNVFNFPASSRPKVFDPALYVTTFENIVRSTTFK